MGHQMKTQYIAGLSISFQVCESVDNNNTEHGGGGGQRIQLY